MGYVNLNSTVNFIGGNPGSFLDPLDICTITFLNVYIYIHGNKHNHVYMQLDFKDNKIN